MFQQKHLALNWCEIFSSTGFSIRICDGQIAGDDAELKQMHGDDAAEGVPEARRTAGRSQSR
jgi:hypothetical protein